MNNQEVEEKKLLGNMILKSYQDEIDEINTGNIRKWYFIRETIAKLNSLAIRKKWVRISSLI